MKNTDIMGKRTMGSFFRSRIKTIIVTLLTFMLTAASGITAYGADTSTVPTGQVNVIIDYLEETARVTAGVNGSRRFYVSKDRKNWELLTGDTLDISTFLKPKEITIYFLGDKDRIEKEVKLPGEVNSLKGAYTVIGGIGRIELSGSTLPVEYRKGANGSWRTFTPPFYTAPYETYGATIYFRTAGSAANRPGKIVSVKIPKRPSAPSVKLDGSKLQISGFKPGETLYRTALDETWRLVTSDSKKRTIDLRDILATTTPPNEPMPGTTLEFMTNYNDAKKKVASAVKIIMIPAQPARPANITLNGTTLTVIDNDKKKQYEYTRITGSGTLDIKTAKWTSFTSSKPVVVKGAAVGDRIFVRAKSYTDTASKQVVPASAYLELPPVTTISLK